MNVYLNLRYTVPERRAMFEAGLKRLGYNVIHGLPASPDGLMVSWNRIGTADYIARQYEAAGLPVLVTENSSWGNSFAGQQWYSLARNRHNTAGMFPVGGNDRWDRLGIKLAPWRTEGETVILPQRGIGAPPTAMPRDWPQTAHAKHGGRVRRHPGKAEGAPLADDLARAGKVVTWGSGAAIKALQWGIPVESDMPDWIGACDNTDAGRLAMFRRLAFAQWTHKELESGEAFAWMLSA